MAGYTSPNWTNDTAPALSAANLQAMSQAVELAQHPFGVCSTAAATAAKTATIDFSGTLSLFAGLCVRIKFANSNSAQNPTLNVNGTGAIPIRSYGNTPATTWIAGQTITFVYDGTNWLFAGIDAFTKGQSLSAETAAAIQQATGTLPATPDAALSLLATAATGVARIESGAYTGNGAYGQANPKTLTFGFTPLLLILWSTYLNNRGLQPLGGSAAAWDNSFLWTKGVAQINTRAYDEGASNAGTIMVSESGNSVSWWANGMYIQFNASGVSYKYVAIGI